MARRTPNRRRLAPACEPLESRRLLSTADPSAAAAESDLLIGLRAGLSTSVVRSVLGLLRPQSLEVLPTGAVRVTPGPKVDLDAVLPRLQRSPLVRYVEANATLTVQATLPNDAQFGRQWGLNSASNIDINAPEAWSVTTGSPSTIVAVIDTGLDLSHPDLAGRVWVNTAEASGRRGVDDDRNGYVDDVNGWNFRDRNANVADGARHGTHVAGIIAAATNNASGVAGVDWKARILPLKFIGADGNGSIADAVKAIYYAVQKGARVINASWSGPDYSASLADAIRYAGTRGVVVVAAAGNEAANNDAVASYPARNRSGNLIAVAAVDQAGRLATFSNYGATTVDIAAPGVSIYSTQAGRGYESLSGTSMATPYVAGVVSLLVAKNPGWTAEQLVQRVVATARRLPGLQGRLISGGIVDAGAALGARTSAASTPAPAAGGTNTPTNGSGSGTTAATAVLSSGDQVRRDLMATPEYLATRAGGSLLGFLDAVYRDALGRPIDAQAATFWLEQLGWQDRGAIAGQILNSPEARATRAARWLIDDVGWPADSLAALKASPTILAWADQLAGGTADMAVRALILGASEFYARSGGTDLSWAAALYDRALSRAIDPAAAQNILNLRAAGVSREAIARTVLNSAESRAARVGIWFLTDLRRTDSITTLKSDPTVLGLAARIRD